ncbi:MAG TPA: hypothetical protein VE521_07330 [Nitrososphaera sp.]|nr:hypothetical protein [Nitrososphaera sp.]
MGSPSEGKRNDRIISALEDDIDYCLDILKINKHDDYEIETKIKKLYEQNIAFLGTYHKRLVALKIIADFITLTSNILSQSKLYDFLMLSAAAATGSAKKEMGLEKALQRTNDIVFKIYGDLIENYETANDILKVNYPRIIVDVVAVLNNGIDMSGKRVSVYQMYDYYLSRKSEPKSNNNIAEVNNISNTIISNEDKEGTEQDTSSDNDLIQTLVRITGRNRKKIEELLARLNKSDIERIRNLCVNYPKIDKYCKFVATDRKHFIDEIERERGGKKLTKYQIQIAVISITKVRKYIENVLDRKFVPHSSHHINHTKHNLEYGYQVMGLIESRKKGGGGGRKGESSSSKR